MSSSVTKSNSNGASKKKPVVSTDRYSLPQLKELRLEFGWTKEEFKTAAKISRSTLDKAEQKNGTVTGSTMGKILSTLNAKLKSPLKLGVDAKLIK